MYDNNFVTGKLFVIVSTVGFLLVTYTQQVRSSLLLQWKTYFMAGITQKPARDTASDELPEAGPSQVQGDGENGESSEHSGSEEETDEGDGVSSSPDDLPEGMDPEGFVGEKVLKPLTPKALAAFQAAQNRAGVIYISRIPPGMRPTKIRHLMSAYGDIGRVYLQQEGMLYTTTRMQLIIL